MADPPEHAERGRAAVSGGSRAAALRRRRARVVTGLFVALVVVLVAAMVGWLERRSIASGYVDDLLRKRGVPARYTIAELGPGGQRLTDVVIGDPARPDLTADWIETETALTLHGVRVARLRAGRVRLRGRVVGGRVSLGAIDRLLPPPSGAPFAFPDIELAVADGRMGLDTPAGPLGVKLTGAGGLQGGFAGQLAIVAPRLAQGGCDIDRASAYLQVRLGAGGAPQLTGPIRAVAARCAGYRARGIVLAADAALDATLARWRGRAAPAIAELRGSGLWLRRIGGRIGFGGDARGTAGGLALTAGPSAAYGASATGLALTGRYGIGADPSFTGQVAARHASLPARWRDAAAGLRGAGAGTPVGPILTQLADGWSGAGRDARVTATLSYRAGVLQIARFASRAASGATIDFAGDGATLSADGVRAAGMLTTDGGGLPRARVTIVQPEPGGAIRGTATIAPYLAGDATLAATPIRFTTTPGGRIGFTTNVTLSGPLGDGGVERARVALTGGWDGAGRVVVNPGCAPAGFDALTIAGLALEPTALTLCPTGRALVSVDRGQVTGGVRLAATRLAGRLGNSRVSIAAAGATLTLADRGLAHPELNLRGLTVRLGDRTPLTRLDIAALDGRIADGGIAGSYAGAGGQIGAVPLVLSDAAGRWALQGGRLTLGGTMMVADAADQPRFVPLAVRDVRLRLSDGIVRADGVVATPRLGVRIADVAIRHRLSDGMGSADLVVPGLTFGPTLQPAQLTRLALGVVADVRGNITGRGRIDWDARGVRSSGAFATDALNLSAAFGPVTGIRGEIRFADLLALRSEPGQQLTIAGINPGVPVIDGRMRYQLLPGPMLRIEGAEWPFAGGRLTLDPALLDYSRDIDKRLTFRVDGLDAAVFLQSFDYKNLNATGIFDGTLPMVFGERGGRIDRGSLAARGGGTLAYVGEVSKENLGVWGNLAFGALRSLRYRELALTLDGPLAGDMVTEARFGGLAQGEGATSNFLTRRIAKLPLVFNVRISAPFRSLIDTAQGFYDPQALIRRNLPALMEQDKIVQPPASAPVPQPPRD